MFVSRDAKDISNLLAFIGRHITMRTYHNDDGRTTLELTPDPRIRNLIGEEGRQRFYLIRTKKLGNNHFENTVTSPAGQRERSNYCFFLISIYTGVPKIEISSNC